MSVREFSDPAGREWRVWDVNPEAIHPQTRNEYYLANMYETGWLVFESKAGDERRRLTEIPRNWSDLDSEGLNELLERAKVIRPHRSSGTFEAIKSETKEKPARTPADLTSADSGASVVRMFRYPEGRYWMVSVIHRPERGKDPVLRFTSGAREIDMTSWPADWAEYDDDQFVELLRKAAPRRPGGPPAPGTPMRRWNDARP